jgi:hypothetical protein
MCIPEVRLSRDDCPYMFFAFAMFRRTLQNQSEVDFGSKGPNRRSIALTSLWVQGSPDPGLMTRQWNG